jgi:23S rRNA (cytosine1962-C5)-methyltransferase
MDPPLPRVVVKTAKARLFLARHPWVLDSAIHSVQGQPADGDVVDLVTPSKEFVARGVFNRRSRIRVRLYSWRPEENLDDAFWRQRIAAACQLRQTLGYTDPQGAARLVHSEGDNLSGLIVDRYGQHLVIQLTAVAFEKRLPLVLQTLAQLCQPQAILLRLESARAKLEGLDLAERWVWGTAPHGPLEIREHGITYLVDPASGQKTGFYLDQRENRRAAAAYLHGRRVLDLCCYSGAFALCAVRLGGAAQVIGIDASRKAIDLARANAQRNQIDRAQFEVGKIDLALPQLASAGRAFGAVILDPPKFAPRRADLDRALRAYARINLAAVRLLQPAGILVTCSCSAHVLREDFLNMLGYVAQQSGRNIQVLQQRGAAPDHPVNASCPESDYLKCFICHVA